ncbi:MAG: four helix bundle protein [Oscillospiraceae bacterium]|nr:four helix bundle protein [Oscillospiraceae bacterium]
MKDNLILDKSMDFAVRIIKLYDYLDKQRKYYDPFKQMLRSGTSIGANVNEAVNGQSKKDFLTKMYIAFKEARETEYWLRLLHKTNFIDDKSFESISKDCLEINKILTTIIKTTKKNMEK